MRRKLILISLLFSLFTLGVTVQSKEGGELELKDYPPLPAHLRVPARTPIKNEALEQYMKQMKEKRLSGVYDYKGNRSGSTVHEGPGKLSDHYEDAAGYLANPCPNSDVWKTIPTRRYEYLRGSWKAQKGTEPPSDKKLFETMMSSQQMKEIMNNPLTLGFNIFDPKPILGMQYWLEYVEKQNKGLMMNNISKVDSNGNVVGTWDTPKYQPALPIWKHFVREVFRIMNERVKKGQPTINPDYMMLITQGETSLKANPNNGCQKYNNLWGFRAFNTTGCSSAQRFNTIEEGIKMVSSTLFCGSPDPELVKNCPYGKTFRSEHNYGNSPISVEHWYSGSFKDELEHPFNKVHKMWNSYLPTHFKRAGKDFNAFKEQFNKCGGK